MSFIERIVPKLEAADCRFVLTQLDQWKKNREPFELAAERERKWANVFGRMEMGPVRLAMERIGEMIRTKSLYPQAGLISKVKAKNGAVIDRVQAVEVRLAMRAFELEHKGAAKGWNDLVPAYLPGVLTNSETGQALTNLFSE